MIFFYLDCATVFTDGKILVEDIVKLASQRDNEEAESER